MQSYSRINKFSNIGFATKSFLSQNKFQLFCLIFFAVLGLLTGILTAIKTGVSQSTSNDYNLSIYCDGSLFSFDVFFKRMLSHTCVLAVLSISSFTIFLVPVSYLIHIYRMYLVGFNCTLLIILFSFSGIFTSIVIILPCQIAITVVFMIYLCFMTKRAIKKRKFGYCDSPKFLKLFFIFLVIMIVLNLIETLLLILLSAKVILVI